MFESSELFFYPSIFPWSSDQKAPRLLLIALPMIKSQSEFPPWFVPNLHFIQIEHQGLRSCLVGQTICLCRCLAFHREVDNFSFSDGDEISGILQQFKSCRQDCVLLWTEM